MVTVSPRGHHQGFWAPWKDFSLGPTTPDHPHPHRITPEFFEAPLGQGPWKHPNFNPHYSIGGLWSPFLSLTSMWKDSDSFIWKKSSPLSHSEPACGGQGKALWWAPCCGWGSWRSPPSPGWRVAGIHPRNSPPPPAASGPTPPLGHSNSCACVFWGAKRSDGLETRQGLSNSVKSRSLSQTLS